MSKNIEDVRFALVEEFDKVRAGEQTPAVLETLSNAAGKMFASCKVQIDYARLVGGTPEIDFLEGQWLKKNK